MRVSVIFFHSLFMRYGRACARTGFFFYVGDFFFIVYLTAISVVV